LGLLRYSQEQNDWFGPAAKAYTAFLPNRAKQIPYNPTGENRVVTRVGLPSRYAYGPQNVDGAAGRLSLFRHNYNINLQLLDGGLGAAL
jgi:hypothetical protein